MQLFRFNTNPVKNAQHYPDKYTYNQIREGEQFLRYALYKSTGYQLGGYEVNDSNSHLSHPITKWAATSLANWLDAYATIANTHREYQVRYGGHKMHDSWTRLNTVYSIAIDKMPRDGYTLQPCAFDSQYKLHDEPTSLSEICDNYRNYAKETKAHLDWWKYDKGRPAPDWL